MNKNLDFHPYIRLAMYHTWLRDYYLERSIFDFEIIFIDSGELKLFIDDTTYICKEGDVCFIPPDTYHRISWHNVNCNQPHIHFDFEKDEISKVVPVSKKSKMLMNSVELTYFRKDYLKERGIHLPYVYKTKYPDRIRSLIFEIISRFTYQNKNPYSSLAMEGLLKTLISIILMENSGYTLDDDKTDILSLMTKFLAENLCTNISLRDLELKFNVTSWSINKIFKDAYDITPRRYYDNLRISYAKNLIVHSFKSIKEIAFSMGFDEPQTFSRWFKNLTGLYPTEYKNKKINKTK